ncbi:L-2-amino-thiazoline-4-carboxylic acid hydrolase [Nocardia sp. XZ_19_369]|uniref:L-2-amino-thiazoline-4-carboxylic acid hydrolase n=1 Tax=Nocardia sp. XZ_19_369 TaxID=2769487 RepID=UPI00188F4371|nr:L-2-amino-thiazoline-4-carboxylic acid hydrolase [Nocardia sp. XZ_19_369]
MHTDPFDLADNDYVPDAARDSAAVVEAFSDHLAAGLPDADLPEDLIADMRGELAELEAADAHRCVDEPARYNLRMTLALVVAYRALRPRLGRDATIAALRSAFVEPLGDAVQEATRSMLDSADDPFAAMVAVSKSREEHAFGAGFTFERPADDHQRYHVDVVQCFYHDVLVAHSASELTPVMCEFDANWIRAIDPAKHGFRFDRATTIGFGGTHCPFHWERTER